jgi:hypothetical protein
MGCRSSKTKVGLTTNKLFYPASSSTQALLRSVPAALQGRPVYNYVVTTIEILPGFHLQQTGSAPNFDGGRITLCTCKHKDRAMFYPSGTRAKPWDNVWVAGVTSISSNPPWTLAYLILVEDAFPDQYTLWSHLPTSCRNAKSASQSTVGDLYEPTPAASANPHSPANYQPPMNGHVHARKRNPKEWHHDIEMWSSQKLGITRPHQLLLGDPDYSYRWLTARMRLRPGAMGRTAHYKMFDTLGQFVGNLI